MLFGVDSYLGPRHSTTSLLDAINNRQLALDQIREFRAYLFDGISISTFGVLALIGNQERNLIPLPTNLPILEPGPLTATAHVALLGR